MDLPKLLADSAVNDSQGLISQIIKPPNKLKGDKEKCLLDLKLNLDNRSIIFEVEKAYQEKRSERQYYYFGNNQAAGSQFFAVREMSGMGNYWIGRMKGIFTNLLEFLGQGELYELLKECQDANLFDAHGLNLQKLDNAFRDSKIVVQKKANNKIVNVQYQDTLYTLEQWINLICDCSSKQQIILIIPCIIKDGKEYVISQHPDYLNAIERFLQGKDTAKKKKSSSVCHICGKWTDSIDTKAFSSKFDRNSVSKIFITKKVNYAPDFNQKLHQRNFAICKECYEKWFAGEKTIMSEYHLNIAGENAVVLFEGILKPLDHKLYEGFKNRIDFAFDYKKIKEWTEEFAEVILEEQEIQWYEFHIIVFHTDGKSCAVKKTIESISNIRFEEVLRAFSQARRMIHTLEQPFYFSLASLYHMIPIKTGKKREQLNVGRILELYAAIINGNAVSANSIWDYYVEAMDIGNKKLRASKIDNYLNLYQLKELRSKYQGNASGREFFFKQMCWEYMALIKTLQILGILDKEVFHMQTQESEQKIIAELSPILQEKEQFLEKHGFCVEAKGLFYLGAMTYVIGQMQYYQDHPNKPVLDKISYTGMSKKDILYLYEEVMMKFKQYQPAMHRKSKEWLIRSFELYSNMAAQYLGNFPEKSMSYNEHEALFYIMSGYSSCINTNNFSTKVQI